jgi:hypothetical protein
MPFDRESLDWNEFVSPAMRVTKGEIFEVRSDLIKWIESKPIKVRKQAKLVISTLATASRESDPAQASVADMLADQVQELRALVAEKRRHRR